MHAERPGQPFEASSAASEGAREWASQRDLLERMLAHAPAGLALLDEALCLRKLNGALAAPLGFEPQALLGRNLAEALPEAHAVWSELLHRALASGEPARANQLAVKGARQTTYWDLEVLPLKPGLLLWAQEVSERVGRERQLHALDQLKADFLNAASHELRTPLTAIKGYAEFLEDQLGGPLTPVQRDHVRQLQAGARRLERVVDDLLDFARLEAGVFELLPLRTDPSRLVERQVELHLPRAREKEIALSSRLPEEEGPSLVVDAERVGQALAGLLDNALKFTPAGGQVEVRLSWEHAAARLEVEDNGPGIAADHIPRIFEKFYQVDPGSTRQHGGNGLGLAVARALIEAHGGRMGVASKPGTGSIFWLTLPY